MNRSARFARGRTRNAGSTLSGRGVSRRRLALVGAIAGVAAAAFALAVPRPANAASLDVSVSPSQPTYADKYTVNWTFDANDFPTNPAEKDFSDPSRYAYVRIILVPAGPLGCAPTEAGSAEYAYRGGYAGGFGPASWLISDAYQGDSVKPLAGTSRMTNLSRIPEGDYILCGYLYDMTNNPEAPDPVQDRQHGGKPDVGPVAHPFTVRPARSAVALSVSPSSVRAGEPVSLSATWSAEAQYEDDSRLGPWNPRLHVVMFPDRGQACPTDLRDELDDSQITLMDRQLLREGESRDATAPDRIDRGNAKKGFVGQPAGRYLLCAYVYRIIIQEEGEPPQKVTTIFTEARSTPTRLEITKSSTADSSPCAKAKQRLKKARNKVRKAKKAVKKAKQNSLGKRKVKKANKRLMRAKTNKVTKRSEKEMAC